MAVGAVLWQRSQLDFHPNMAAESEPKSSFVPLVVQAQRGQRRGQAVQHLSQLRFNLSVPPRSENLVTKFHSPKAIFLENVQRNSSNQGNQLIPQRRPQASGVVLERLQQASLLARHDLRHGHAALSVDPTDRAPSDRSVPNSSPSTTGAAVPTQALSTGDETLAPIRAPPVRNSQQAPSKRRADVVSASVPTGVTREHLNPHEYPHPALASKPVQKIRRDGVVSTPVERAPRTQEAKSKTVRAKIGPRKSWTQNNLKTAQGSETQGKSVRAQDVQMEVADLHHKLCSLVEHVGTSPVQNSAQPDRGVTKPTRTVQSRLHGGQAEVDDDSESRAAWGNEYAARLARTFYAIQQKVRHLSSQVDGHSAPGVRHIKKTETLRRLIAAYRSAVRAVEELLRQHCHLAKVGQSKAWQRRLVDLLQELTLCCSRVQVTGVNGLPDQLVAHLIEGAAAPSHKPVTRPSLNHLREPSAQEKVWQWRSGMKCLDEGKPEFPSQPAPWSRHSKKVRAKYSAVRASHRPKPKLRFAQSAVHGSCRSWRCVACQTESSRNRREIIQRQRDALARHVRQETKIQQRIESAAQRGRRLESFEEKKREEVTQRRTVRKKPLGSMQQGTVRKTEKNLECDNGSEISTTVAPSLTRKEHVLEGFDQSLAHREIQRQLWLEEKSKEQALEIQRLHNAHQDDLAVLQDEIATLREMTLQNQQNHNCGRYLESLRNVGPRGAYSARPASPVFAANDRHSSRKTHLASQNVDLRVSLQCEDSDDSDNLSFTDGEISSAPSTSSSITLRGLLKKLERMEAERLDICQRWRHVTYPESFERCVSESNTRVDGANKVTPSAGHQAVLSDLSKSVSVLQERAGRFAGKHQSVKSTTSVQLPQVLSQAHPVGSSLSPADVPVNMLGSIHANEKRFSDYTERSANLYSGGPNQRAVIESVSEALLDDLLSDVMRELEQVCDQAAEDVYEHEFKTVD